MNLKETIERRISVRTFDKDRNLKVNDIEAIRHSIRDDSTPFGGRFTIDFKKFDLI